MDDGIPNHLMSAKELAAATGIPERSILKAARDGVFASSTLRRRIYIDPVDFFEKTRTHKPTQGENDVQ